jgi:benzoate-CoA ligase
MAERPKPDAVFRRWLCKVEGLRPTVFFGAPTGFAAILAQTTLPPRATRWRCA